MCAIQYVTVDFTYDMHWIKGFIKNNNGSQEAPTLQVTAEEMYIQEGKSLFVWELKKKSALSPPHSHMEVWNLNIFWQSEESCLCNILLSMSFRTISLAG